MQEISRNIPIEILLESFHTKYSSLELGELKNTLKEMISNYMYINIYQIIL